MHICDDQYDIFIKQTNLGKEGFQLLLLSLSTKQKLIALNPGLSTILKLIKLAFRTDDEQFNI